MFKNIKTNPLDTLKYGINCYYISLIRKTYNKIYNNSTNKIEIGNLSLLVNFH